VVELFSRRCDEWAREVGRKVGAPVTEGIQKRGKSFRYLGRSFGRSKLSDGNSSGVPKNSTLQYGGVPAIGGRRWLKDGQFICVVWPENILARNKV